MEFESETPPSSPIFGYSGSRDEQSLIDSGVVYCLNCKGVPRPSDHSFSSESYILRRELITAIETIKVTGNLHEDVNNGLSRLTNCFNGHLFDLLDKEQVELVLRLCRKAIASLEFLSNSANSISYQDIRNAEVAADDCDELSNQNPWKLRKSICHFFNLIVRRLKLYRTLWKPEDFEKVFVGLRKSLGVARQWSSLLQDHCGARNGNECSSSTYHFFHLQLELRWSLLLIYEAKESVIQWILDDLIFLSLSIYNKEILPLDEKQPFNCACVKEIWVMLRLLFDEVLPQKKPFWEHFGEAMKRCTEIDKFDKFFPIWLTTYLSDASNYTAAGVYSPKAHGSNNGYKFLREYFKEWNGSGKSVEIARLCFKTFKNWGADGDILLSLWRQWIPRLDKSTEFSSDFHSFSSIYNWLELIFTIVNNLGEELTEHEIDYLGTNKDPFFYLVRLIGCYAKSCNEKDIKRFNSNLIMKLSNADKFGELGIIRVSTLLFVIISVVDSDREALSLGERLPTLFVYEKEKGQRTVFPSKLKATLRVYSILILLLLRRKLDMTTIDNVILVYMKIVDELLSHLPSTGPSSTGELSHKDLIMIYIDTLENLPNYTPSLNKDSSLGRHNLISPNFTMWLSSCDPNYLLRTMRMLKGLSSWILKWTGGQDEIMYNLPGSATSSEAKEILSVISEKSLPCIKNCVLRTQNRIPSTDMKPIAEFAADITILRFKLNYQKPKQNEHENLFSLFSLHNLTCPVVSQHFIERLFAWKAEGVCDTESLFPPVQWAQVWIRLVALGCTVPEKLTELLLGGNFASTSNQELLDYFCKHCDDWSKNDLQNILKQLVKVLESIMKGTFVKEQISVRGEDEAANVINSVIKTCAVLLNSISFNKLYIKSQATSVGHLYLNSLVPPPWPGVPPWEKLSTSVMKALEENLFHVFLGIVQHTGLESDEYLKRKLKDLVILALFGFLKEQPSEADRGRHPALKILTYCNKNNVTLVETEILPKYIAGEDTIIKDEKLYVLFLRAVNLIRQHGLATYILKMGSGVIRAFLLHPNINKTSLGQCLNAIVYCCMAGSTPAYKDLAVQAFDVAFQKEFDHKSQRCFDFCISLTKSSGPSQRDKASKRFLAAEIIPMLERYVASCERKRASGNDTSLRRKLEIFKTNLQTALAEM